MLKFIYISLLVEGHVAKHLAAALTTVDLGFAALVGHLTKLLLLHRAVSAVTHVDVVLVTDLVRCVVVRLGDRHLNLAVRLHHHHLLGVRLHLLHWVVHDLRF